MNSAEVICGLPEEATAFLSIGPLRVTQPQMICIAFD